MSALAAMRAEVYDACAVQASAQAHPHPHVKEAFNPFQWGKIVDKIHDATVAFDKANPTSKVKKQLFEKVKDLEIKNIANRRQGDNLGKQVAVATLASVPMLGLAFGIPAGQSLLERRRQRANYQRMLERNPELAQEDPEKVRESYEVLEAFAPSMTKNPQVAGSFVQKNLEYEAVDPAEVKNLIDIQKGVGDSSSERLSDQFMRAGVQTLSAGPMTAIKSV